MKKEIKYGLIAVGLLIGYILESLSIWMYFQGTYGRLTSAVAFGGAGWFFFSSVVAIKVPVRTR